MATSHAGWSSHYRSHLHLAFENVVVVRATVLHELPADTDTTPPLHQLFFVRIDRVRKNPMHVPIDVGAPTLVAVHYGDPKGLPAPIPNLEPGQPITIKGTYLPAAYAHRGPDGAIHPVLHWAHHPKGWVVYRTRRYV